MWTPATPRMDARMIKSFRDKRLESIHQGRKPGKGFPQDLLRTVQRKLQMMESAAVLDDLKVPPNNRLEALRGDREGQHSIRVNKQWRICFMWENDGPVEVEMVDYH